MAKRSDHLNCLTTCFSRSAVNEAAAIGCGRVGGGKPVCGESIMHGINHGIKTNSKEEWTSGVSLRKNLQQVRPSSVLMISYRSICES